MGHTPLSTHANHVRGIYPYPMWSYRRFKILLHAIKYLTNVLRLFQCYTATPSDSTYFNGYISWITFHTPLIMHARHVIVCCPCTWWVCKWYETLLHAMYYVKNVMRPFPCYCYPQWRYLFWSLHSMDYDPHPVLYARDPCQKYLNLPCMVIERIWNTASCNTSFNKCSVTMSMPLLPPVTIPIPYLF